MKYLVALFLLAVNFNPAEFHPIDEIISLEIADFTNDSSDSLIQNRTKEYDGDLVSVSVENGGGLSEYVGFQVYLPEQVDLLEFNSKSTGPRVKPLKRKTSKNSPLQLDSLTDDEILVHEMQTASTRSFISGGNEISFNLNYQSEDSKESKLSNQFLSVLDLYSEHPENMRVKLKSANFAHGKYPDSAKHRWLVRAHPGHTLLVNFEEIDVEKGADQVTVYDVQSDGTKRLVGEVTVTKQLKVLSNEIMVVFKSDCSVGRGGFSAVVTAVRDDVITTTESPVTTTEAPTCGTPEETENGYYVISDGDVIAKDGVNVTYYCNENYTLADHSNVTLQCFDGAFEPLFIDANIYCNPDPIWSEWEEGMCSKACLGGSRTDKRVCIHGNCESASEIIVDCNDRTCDEAAATCGSGVQSKSKVADNQLSASSFWDSETNHHFRHGRLFGVTGVAAWVAATTAANEWIQVDYLDQVEITGVATQGRGEGETHGGHDQWVSQYTVSYKSDENGIFQYVTDESGATILFPGNYDKETVVANQFPSVIKARYFRINPTAWHKFISLRFEFLTC